MFHHILPASMARLLLTTKAGVFQKGRTGQHLSGEISGTYARKERPKEGEEEIRNILI